MSQGEFAASIVPSAPTKRALWGLANLVRRAIELSVSNRGHRARPTPTRRRCRLRTEAMSSTCLTQWPYAVIVAENPHLIIPEVEAIATDTLVELEGEGFRCQLRVRPS